MLHTPKDFLGESVQKVCNECGKTFDLFFPSLANLVHTCPDCCEKHAIEESRELIARSGNVRLQQWLKLCPEIFQDTNEQHKNFPRELFAKVMAWTYGGKGLLLTGSTGKCKSRCVWLLLKREFIDGKRNFEAIDHSVGFQYGEQFAKSSAEASRWVQKLSKADILLMDDVFKVKLTDSLEAALFTVISNRTEHKKPILCTLNDTGATLSARMSEDRGKALVRRLGEFCTVINFSENKEAK